MGPEAHIPSWICSVPLPDPFLTSLLNNEECLINSPTNSLLYGLLETDKGVIRVDMQALQEEDNVAVVEIKAVSHHPLL